MNCGFCAEFCPFNAIKMGHEIEIAVFDRADLLLDLPKLRKPLSYHAQIHPTDYAQEQKGKGGGGWGAPRRGGPPPHCPCPHLFGRFLWAKNCAC